MKLAVMQPYFIPYIGYFQMLNAVDKYILYENLPFIKHGWMNRNFILQKNGLPLLISVPLEHKSSNTLISNIKIFNKLNWHKKLLKDIYFNYTGASAFNEVYPFLENLFDEYNYSFLYELNNNLITSIADFLEIKTQIVFENKEYVSMEKKLFSIYNNDNNCLPSFNNSIPDKKTARILEICNRNNADIYINAIGGQKLYNKEEFHLYGIDLKFLKTEEFKYKQFKNVFIPNLSIIDVMMHNGKEGTKRLLNQYTLI